MKHYRFLALLPNGSGVLFFLILSLPMKDKFTRLRQRRWTMKKNQSIYAGANPFLLEHIQKRKTKTKIDWVWVLLVVSLILNLILGWGYWKWRGLAMYLLEKGA